MQGRSSSRNPNLDAGTTIDEWTRLTFGNDPVVVKTISDVPLASWHVYESDTARHCIHDLQLRPGDTIRIEGTPDRGERAPLDYVEIVSSE